MSFHKERLHVLSRLMTHFHRYNFKSDPRSIGAVVLLSANESSYTGKSPKGRGLCLCPSWLHHVYRYRDPEL